MQKSSIFNHYYLNRLALSADAGIVSVDPFHIITDFFSDGDITEMKGLLDEACRVALEEEYCWQEGSPGNLLYFYNNLEKLVEACYLICKEKKYQKKLSKRFRRVTEEKIIQDLILPCSLSKQEIAHPFSVLQLFFACQGIRQWKKDLYTWLEAGLSACTVLDSANANTLLPYRFQLQKLMDVCWYIRLQIIHKPNNKGL